MYWKASQSNISLLRKFRLSQIYLACRSQKDRVKIFRVLETFGGKKVKALPTERLVTKTWSRSSIVLPSFVGKYFLVYSGFSFIKLFVERYMVGHRVGQFILTKKVHSFKSK